MCSQEDLRPKNDWIPRRNSTYRNLVIPVLVVVKGFFFQAEDGIRDAQESRGLGDVYKRQVTYWLISCTGRAMKYTKSKSKSLCLSSKFGYSGVSRKQFAAKLYLHPRV